MSRSEKKMLEIVKIFEERLNQFEKDINDKNIMFVLLKAHLYIEHELDLLLKANLKHAEYVNLERMGFTQKSKLTFAMGLLPSVDMEIIMKINQLRNKFAHSLDFKLDETVVEMEMVSQFSNEIKTSYNQSLNYYIETYGPGVEGKLRCVLANVWMHVIEFRIIPEDIRRELREFEKSYINK